MEGIEHARKELQNSTKTIRKNTRIVGKRVIVNYQTLWEKYWRIVRKEQCSVRTLDSTVKG